MSWLSLNFVLSTVCTQFGSGDRPGTAGPVQQLFGKPEEQVPQGARDVGCWRGEWKICWTSLNGTLLIDQ